VPLDLTGDRDDRVRREGAPLRVVPVDGLDQAEPGHLLKIVEGLAAAAVAAGHPSGERQAQRDEPLPQLGPLTRIGGLQARRVVERRHVEILEHLPAGRALVDTGQGNLPLDHAPRPGPWLTPIVPEPATVPYPPNRPQRRRPAPQLTVLPGPDRGETHPPNRCR
jgi:hypothetical protein